MQRKVVVYKFSMLHLILVVLLVLSFTGGSRAVAPLMKFVLPLLIVYFIYRGIKSILFPKPPQARYYPGGAFRHQHPGAGGQAPATHTTIEICPDCGNERGSRHLCSVTKT